MTRLVREAQNKAWSTLRWDSTSENLVWFKQVKAVGKRVRREEKEIVGTPF